MRSDRCTHFMQNRERQTQDNIFHYVDLFQMMRGKGRARIAVAAGAVTKIKTLREIHSNRFESIYCDCVERDTHEMYTHKKNRNRRRRKNRKWKLCASHFA